MQVKPYFQLRVCGILFCLLPLSACQTIPPVPLTLSITSAKQLNLDQQQRSLPLVIRVYQLKELDDFLQNSFHELWHQPSAQCQQAIVSQKEIVITPNNLQKITLPREEQARFIAVAGLFRQVDSDRWRDVVRLPMQATSLFIPINIVLTTNQVRIVV